MSIKIYPTASPLELELDATMRGKDGSLYCVTEGKRGKYWKLASFESENEKELYADFLKKTVITNEYMREHQVYCDKFVDSMYEVIFAYKDHKNEMMEKLYEFQSRHVECCSCIKTAVMGCPYCIAGDKMVMLSDYANIYSKCEMGYKMLKIMLLKEYDDHFGNYVDGSLSKYICHVEKHMALYLPIPKTQQRRLFEFLIEKIGDNLSQDAVNYLASVTPYTSILRKRYGITAKAEISMFPISEYDFNPETYNDILINISRSERNNKNAEEELIDALQELAVSDAEDSESEADVDEDESDDEESEDSESDDEDEDENSESEDEDSESEDEDA